MINEHSEYSIFKTVLDSSRMLADAMVYFLVAALIHSAIGSNWGGRKWLCRERAKGES
jgi:hypothetical protein